MYPFEAERPYLTQCWYAAAWSTEVGRHLLERTILDEPLVLFRTEAGVASALHGICPHRGLPLALGTLKGDTVACAYHGFCFDTAGRCARIPTQARPPENFRMRSYPVAERGGMVWVWMGDPARAQDTPPPDVQAIGMGRSDWASCGHSHIETQARWGLLLDNLFDLSHIGWVHAKTIGASLQSDDEGVAALVMVPPVLEEKDGGFVVRRLARDCPVDPFLRFLHPQAPERVDVDLYSELLTPAVINAGSRALDAASGRLLGNLNFIHIITPATATSSHYFGVVTRDFRIDDPALSGALGAQDNAVRAEDKAVVEAVERHVERHGDTRRELSGTADAGGIRLRRRISALLQAEAGAATAAA